MSNNNEKTTTSISEQDIQWLVDHAPTSIVEFVMGLKNSEEVATRTAAFVSEKLKESEETKRLLLESAAEGIYGIDVHGKTTFINPAAERMLGFKPNELLGKSIHEMVHHSHQDGSAYPVEYCPIMSSIQNDVTKQADNEVFWKEDGGCFPVRYTSTPIKKDDEIVGAVITFSDITEELAVKKELKRLAYFDYLTALPNRANFEEMLGEALRRSERHELSFAVLYIDLDNFKLVNDTLGHDVGDRLLQQVAKRLQYTVRAYDFVARLGGDEFAIVLQDVKLPTEAGKLAEKIIGALSGNYELDEHSLNIGVSIGVACYPHAGRTVHELLKSADIALYRAKNAGGNAYQYFTDSLNQAYRRQTDIERALQTVLPNDELFLVYQPQFELKTNRIIGVEVLLRWRHPYLGLISPNEFIPLSEENDEIKKIGYWVYENACKQYIKWQPLFQDKVKFSLNLNLSPIQLMDHEFINKVDDLTKAMNLPAGCIELELTETAVVTELNRSAGVLNQLHRLGFQIAIDDFGTGYSSLGRLKDLPVTTLKIDSSFVRDIATNSNDAMIVKSIINLAHNLKLNVVAEGIETQEQYDFLLESQCPYGQGFHLCRPLPPDDLEKFIKEQQTAKTSG